MASFFRTLFKPEENSEIIKLLIDNLNVKVTLTTLTKEIEEHPDYPSLLSISDVLTAHGIENMSLKIDTAELEKIPLPCIAVIRDIENHKDSFTLIKSISDTEVEYYDLQNRSWKNISKEKFRELWPSQIVLVADAENAVEEKDYAEKVTEEKRKHLTKFSLFLFVPVLAIIAGVFTFINYGSSSLLTILFTLFTLTGCVVAGLLIWYELDEYNPALQQICSAGKKINCSAILNSKASKIFGISWSVIGFTYFFGGLMLLLFSGIYNSQSLIILSWLNVLAATYIIFSVYYQWRVAKQWCVLCLFVQALLALQLTTTLIAGWQVTAPLSSITSYQILIPVLLAYAIPFAVTSLLIPAYRSAKESKTNRHELQRLKHNRQIFDALLAKQKQVSEEPDGLGIILGNPDAQHKIIKVCSPYCGPCAKAHAPIEALLENNPDVQVQIIFTATNQPGDIKAPPVKHLLAIADKRKNEEIIKHALDDWYFADKKDYDVFAAKYPMNGELQKQNDKVEAMRKWCDKVGIEFTPTFFINGSQLPDIYSVNDLKYFLSV